MAKIFISYRRADSAAFAGRIYDRLVAKFGRKNIFKDVDDIPAGVDFAEYIQDSLRDCGVELVIIGSDWADARTPEGDRRLDDPGDFVRLEIETALALGLSVIPVLVANATMPAATLLPPSLERLTRLPTLQVRNDPDFSHDMNRAIDAIERALAARPSGGLRRRVAPSFGGGRAGMSSPAMPSPGPIAPTPAPASRSPGVTTIDRPYAQPRTSPRLPAFLAGRQSLVAGLAVLLLVASFAALLTASRIGQALFAGRTQPTPTMTVPRATQPATLTAGQQMTQTAGASSQATAVAALVFPFRETAPSCDNWQVWNVSPSSAAQCSSGSAVTLKEQCDPSPCQYGDMKLSMSSFPRGVAVPTSGTVSVQVGRLTSGAQAEFTIDFLTTANATPTSTATSTYLFDIVGFGQWNIDRTGPTSQPNHIGDGGVNAGAMTTVTFAYSPTSVTCSVNGHVVGTHNEPNSISLDQVELRVDGASGDHADFSNLSIEKQ